MKKILCVIVAISCILTISGCKKKENEKSSSSKTASTSKTSSISSSSSVSLVPETGFALELRPTIKKAIELYYIFFVSSLELDRTQSIDLNNDKYYLITSTKYKNVAEIEAAVSSVFTKEKKDIFFAFPKYVDNKDKIYCLDTKAETKYDWKDFNTTVIDKTDATATIKVSVLLVKSSTSRVDVNLSLVKENNVWHISDYESLS